MNPIIFGCHGHALLELGDIVGEVVEEAAIKYKKSFMNQYNTVGDLVPIRQACLLSVKR